MPPTAFTSTQSCCRRCLSEDIEWIKAGGKGKVYSFTIVHRPPSLVFEDDVPYVVAIIELDEGPRVMSNIVEMDPEKVRVDMRVEVAFDDITPAITVPRFRTSES